MLLNKGTAGVSLLHLAVLFGAPTGRAHNCKFVHYTFRDRVLGIRLLTSGVRNKEGQLNNSFKEKYFKNSKDS